MKAYRGNIIFTPTCESFEIIPGGYILVDDSGVIAGVYTSDAFAHSDEIEVVDFGNKLLTPAMNDLHVHAPQFANMGIAMDVPLLLWLNKYTFPEEAKFADIDYARTIYMQFVDELVKQGTMRAAVFATVHTPATLLLADLFHQKGIGAHIGLVGMDRNSPDNLCNQVDEAISGTEQLMDYTKNYPLVNAIVTPRFVPSCSPEMLRALAQQANALELPIQSHLCETPNEIKWVKELEPEALSYADVYHRYGLLTKNTLMAHCVYPSDVDIALLQQTGTTIVHCPTSNCNLTSGIAPIRQLLDAGIPVTLGSDVAAGHDLSMFQVMQSAIQVSKLNSALHNRQIASLSLPEVFYMATKLGGSFFGKVGSFEPGYEFDALVIDSDVVWQNSETAYEQLYTRLERFVYHGNVNQIVKRFCKGKEI